ncbi:MAG: toll/interleukin-1 receptor domain-containing protein, partial [Nitrososphaera sp.]|nr:toll/interleukin-1 receptor domain-containing protein [Nitrososphaera sp.]
MIEPTEHKHDLFILSSDADQEWIRGYLLPALGLTSERLITRQDFRPGAPIVEEFERAVTTSRYTLLVFSPAFVNDEWSIFGEQLVAHASITERRDRLIPLLLQPCELPLHVEFLVHLDCTGEANWENEMARLRHLLDQ